MKSQYELPLFAVCSILIVLLVGSIRPNVTFRESIRNDSRERYDRPFEAQKFFYEQRAYPFGKIPDDAYEKAYAHVQKMSQLSLAKGMGSWVWNSIGPTNIAGRIKAIVIDPKNPQIVYVGAAGGGVWKSTNDGSTWRALTDFMPNLRINALAIHPTNSNILIAGCGEGWVLWQGGYMYGRGIYRTEDGGENWTLLAATNIANFQYIFDLSFDPFTPSTMLASTDKGIFRSSDDGATWSKKFPQFGTARALHSVFAKTKNGVAYAAMSGGSSYQGLYKSTDAGQTWIAINSGISIPSAYSRIQLAVAPSNSDILLAAYVDDATDACAAVYKSIDGGTSWQIAAIPRNEWNNDTYVGPQGSYNNALVFHPTDPNIIYAGGIDVYKSQDGARSWIRITNAYTPSTTPFVHPDHHAIAVHPTTPQTVYFGHDGGMTRTVSGGISFDSKNTGLSVTQFHSVAPHPTTDQVIGGTQDNGNLVSFGGSTSFTDATGADGGYAIIDYTNPQYVYAEAYFLWFRRSANGGSPGTFQDKMNGIPRATQGEYQYPGTTDRVSFYAPFEMDPVNSSILYAGTYRLFKTTNRADNWTAITNDITGSPYSTITSIAIAKSNTKVLYVGSSGGMIQVSTDGGASWSAIRNGLPSRYVSDLAVDPNNAAIAYVTFSGFSSGHIYRTTDYGSNWENISGSGVTGIPDVPCNTVLVHPTKPNTIYVGSDFGAYETTDGGQNWSLINSGMGNVTVADLRLRKDGILFAATHGRGLFRSSYSLLDTQSLNRPFDFTLGQNFPNPFGEAANSGNPSTFIRYEIGTASNVTLHVFDITGRLVNTIVDGQQQAGKYAVEFNGIGFGSGVYLYRLTAGNRSTMKAMVLMK